MWLVVVVCVALVAGPAVVPGVAVAVPGAGGGAALVAEDLGLADGLGLALVPGSGVEPAAQGEVSALAAAAVLGERVEIADLTTETERHLANPDGTIFYESYAAPQRVRREGGWVPVDTMLGVVGGRVAPAATVLDISLSAGGRGETVRLEHGDRWLSLSWPEPLPAPELSGDTARYREVLPGVDLVIRVGVDSFSQVLEVRSRLAAAGPGLERLAWGVSRNGLELRARQHGGVEVVAPGSGEVVFAAPVSVMWDSPRIDDSLLAMMGEEPPELGGSGGVAEPGRIVVMDTELSGGELVVHPDRSMLTDPDTNFPVFIDPGFTGLRIHWANVFAESSGQGWTNDSAWPRAGGMRVGLLDWPNCGDGCGLWRSVVRLGVSDNVHGRDVVSAAVKMTQTHTGGCDEYYIRLYQVSAFTSGVSWDGVSWLGSTYLQRRLVASSNSDGCSTDYPNRSVTFNNSNVVATVQNAANKDHLSVSYGVLSNNEGDRNQWRRISRDSLKLEVTYDAYPGTPTSVKVAGGAADCKTPCASPATVRVTRPFLQGRVSKSFTSDFPNVRAEFQLRNAATSAIVGTHTTSLQKSPFTFEWRAPTLTNGVAYKFRVRGINSSGGVGPWSSYFQFTIDTAGPGTPADLGVDSTGSCFPAGSCASPAMLNDPRPVFKVTPQHPMDDPTTVGFEVRNADRSQVVATGTVLDAADGSKATWQPTSDLPQQVTLHLRARSTADLHGRAGPWTGYFTFTVDSVAPGAPLVSSALYAHKDTGTWNGGVGQSGVFAFDPNGAADVVSYQWKFNGGQVSDATVAPGGSHTVSLAPPGDLEQLLEVRTIDHAGNISPWRAYPFYVRPQPADAGYWKFNEGAGTTAASAIGSSFDGVLRGGAGWAASGINPSDPQASGTAILLDGVDSYVEMPPVLATNHAAGFTISAWVNPTDLSADRTVVAQRGDNTYMFRLFYRGVSDQWCFDVRHSDNPQAASALACAATTPQTGVWTHLVGVYDNPAGLVRLWVNGGPNNGSTHPDGEMVQAAAPAAWPATGSFQVGLAYSDGFFAGRVDEVRALQQVVPEIEVINMFLSCVDDQCPPVPEPDPVTLVGAWDFEETTGTVAEDGAELGNDATLLGGAQRTVFGHGGGRAVWFDGTSAQVATDSHVLLTDQAFTVSAWVRLEQRTHWYSVVSQDAQALSPFRLEYDHGAETWCFLMRHADQAFSGRTSACGPTPVLDTWTHLVGVYDPAASQIRLYVDGQPAGTAAYTQPGWQGTGPFTIGRTLSHTGDGSPAYNWFPGMIDTVRAYQGAADDAQVASWYADQSTPPPDPGPPLLAGDWRMDDKSGGSVFDHTFFGNDGTLSGGVDWPAPGQAYAGTYGLVFDGLSGAVTTFFPPVLTDDAFTVSAWANSASTAADQAAVAIEGGQAAVATLGYDAAAGAYCFTMAHADQVGAATTSACAAGGTQAGVWAHLVGVFDKRERTMLLYVDGDLAAAVTYGGLQTWQATGTLSMGRTMVGGQPGGFWHGRLALVRAWQGALDAAAVTNLYQQQLDPTPTAVITTPEGGQWTAGQQVSFSGMGTDLSGQLPVSALTWTLTAYDCADPADPGCQPEVLQTWVGVGSGTFTAPDRTDPVNLRLELTADNGTGLLGVASVVWTPATVALTFTTDPQGLDLSAAGHTAQAPLMLTVVQGSTVDVAAPEPQELDEVLYGFGSWAHGGPAAQQITAPAADTTYTATYLPLDLTPDAVIDAPPVDLAWVVGQQITVAGQATDPITGVPLPDSALSWRIVAYRCVDESTCEETVVAEWAGVPGGTFAAPDVTHPAYLEIELTADNGPGWVNTVAVQIDPQTVDLTFTTDPTGLQLTVDDAMNATPLILPAIVGSTVELSAPSPQDLGGTTYIFDNWAHGGQATHTITVPAAATTYTATFVAAQQATGTVTGTVSCDPDPVSPNPTQPVSGATVTIAGLSALTSFLGQFTIEDVPVGEHELSATPPALSPCPPGVKEVTVENGEVTQVTVLLIAGIN